MTERTLAALAEPWRRFPQTVMFYAVMWVVGAVVLTFLHIWFPPPQAFAPPAPRADVPSRAPDATPTPTSAPPINEISAVQNMMAWNNAANALDLVAWHNALTANDLEGYRTYILESPRSPLAHKAAEQIKKLQSDDMKLQSAEMQLADSGSGVPFVAQLLEHKDSDPLSLEEFVAKLGLKYKYPLGYALFYSDGTQFLSYETSVSGAIRFDPSVSKVTFQKTPEGKGIMVCLDFLPIRVNGKVLTNFRDNCFGSANPIMHAVRLGDVSLDFEYLATSPRGAAWVMGMTP